MHARFWPALIALFAVHATGLPAQQPATPIPSEPAPTLGGADVGEAFKNAPDETGIIAPAATPDIPRFDPDVMLPPAWAFGVLYGCYTDQAGALAKAKRLIAGDFPIDALWVDSAFWDVTTYGPQGYINFKGDPKGFPDPAALWRDLRGLGLRNGIWTWDRLNNTESHYAEFKEKGFFKDTIVGNSWHNHGTKAEAGAVDFDNPAAAARWSELMLPLIEQGLDFYKIDAYPAPAYVRTHFELSRKAVLARGGRGFLLSHPRNNFKKLEMMKGYPTCWTSDSVAEWDQPPDPKTFRSGGFVQQIRKYAGVDNDKESLLPFLTNDTGGYWPSTSKDPAARDELYQRWVQFSAFGPIMEVFAERSAATGNEPLAYSPAAQENFRRYTHLRMRLFPYIYTQAHLTRQEGRRMIQGEPAHPTQYRFGTDFWVAPVHAPGATSWPVALPPGLWFNYWTGERAEGGRAVEVPVDLQTLPLFVRGGAIIPLRDYTRTLELGSNQVLTLELFPQGNSEFTLYEDDGLSLGYLDDQIARTTIRSIQKGSALSLTIEAIEGDYVGRLAERTYIVKLRSHASPTKITLNGAALAPSTDWQRRNAAGRVVTDPAEPADLLIQFKVPTARSTELVIE